MPHQLESTWAWTRTEPDVIEEAFGDNLGILYQ